MFCRPEVKHTPRDCDLGSISMHCTYMYIVSVNWSGLCVLCTGQAYVCCVPGRLMCAVYWSGLCVLCTGQAYVCCVLGRFGYDYGQIHFVMMSTEHDFDIGTEQYYFLKDHLESVDRSVHPLAHLHRATGSHYTCCKHCAQ